MKFGIFALSTAPGTLAERERLRPIGRNNERVQQMFEELRAIAIRADQSGSTPLQQLNTTFIRKGWNCLHRLLP
jgi:hypothetical protein